VALKVLFHVYYALNREEYLRYNFHQTEIQEEIITGKDNCAAKNQFLEEYTGTITRNGTTYQVLKFAIQRVLKL